MQGTAPTPEHRDADDGLTAPSVRSVLVAGLPGFLREGFLPLGAFYTGFRLSGLVAGMAAAGAVSVLVYAIERRAGRDGLLVRLSLAFVALQTVIGLVSRSATAYLATPVLANAIWGAAFLASAALGRPLAGELARAWFPFPKEFRESAKFKRVYGIESVVWGVYLLARSAIRLAALLGGSLGDYLVIAFVTGVPMTLGLLAWSVWYAVRRLSDDAESDPKRTGPLRDRIVLRLSRSLGVAAWRVGERLGVDVAGASEGPAVVIDDARRETFERLIATARAGDGVVATATCSYPTHELLTYLAVEHGLLLHGSNRTGLDVLEPQPARDWATALPAVVACDDGIWPIFYGVVARDRVDGVFSACLHIGRPPHLRRYYMFALGGEPATPSSWTSGVVYALPRDGFRREWGNEWVSARPVRPLLCVPVRPDDLPLRETVLGLSTEHEFRRVRSHLRAAKRARAAAGGTAAALPAPALGSRPQ